MMMKKQQGFTMIELVMVIVILGILAAIAAPKFVDLQKDARIAAVNGMKAAIQSGTTMVHAKALINNASAGAQFTDMNNNGTTTLADGDVEVTFLYPTASNNGLTNLVDLDGFTRATAVFSYGSPALANCNVTYVGATAASLPTYTVVTTGC